MKAIAVILALLTAVVQWRLWVDAQGLPALSRLDALVEEQAVENVRLADRNARLRAEVEDLRTGLQGVEARARRDLGMLGRDEIFFQIDPALNADPSGDGR